MKKKNTNIKRCDLNEGIAICGLPIVPIDVNGKTCYFLLDTGAQNNGVSDADPEALACFKPSEYVIQNTGLDGHSCFTPLGSLSYSIAGHSFEDQFSIIPGSTFASIKQTTGLLISGIMGITFMVKHNCVLDFDKGLVSIIIQEENDNNDNEVIAA